MNRIQAMTRHRVFHPRLRDRNGSLGQSVVEFAMIVPIALVMLGGALDMGRLFHTSVSLENAAREGAFYGASDPRCDTSAQTFCTDPNTADWRVRNEAVGLSGLNVSFACTSGGTAVALTSCQAGDLYETTVTTTFDLVTPLLMPIFGMNMDLGASATAVVLTDAFDPNATPQPQGLLCTVPNLIGMERNLAHDAWGAVGFVMQNFDWPGMSANDIVATQSIPAGWTEPCATAEMTVTG